MPKKIHNLPITGIASFAKYPICTILTNLMTQTFALWVFPTTWAHLT